MFYQTIEPNDDPLGLKHVAVKLLQQNRINGLYLLINNTESQWNVKIYLRCGPYLEKDSRVYTGHEPKWDT